jgi:hypothetical protein
MSRLAPPSNGALWWVKPPPPGNVGGGKPGRDWAWLAKAEHVIATANTAFKIVFFIVKIIRLKKRRIPDFVGKWEYRSVFPLV